MGKLLRAENVNKVSFSDLPPSPGYEVFHSDVDFTVLIVYLYKVERVCFTKCQLISSLVIKESKQVQPYEAFSIATFTYFLSTFLFVWWQYCPSLTASVNRSQYYSVT